MTLLRRSFFFSFSVEVLGSSLTKRKGQKEILEKRKLLDGFFRENIEKRFLEERRIETPEDCEEIEDLP